MAYIGVTSTTETTIGVKMYGLDTKYTKADRVCRWYLNGNYKGTSTLGGGISSGGAYTFKSLKAGTKYDISVSISAPGWGSSVELSTTASTDDPKVKRPDNWAWYSSITSGGKIGLTALEWNDFTARINEFREYKGLSKYSFIKVSKGMTITATIVNQAAAAIRAMNNSAPSNVYAGGTIYASFFNNLKNALNNIS